MGKNCLKICVCLCVLIGGAVSISADTEREKLNFKEALEQAFDHNPAMVAARQAVASAEGDLITARTLQNPDAELEFGGFKKDANDERDVRLNSIEIKQPFDPIGVWFFKQKIASNQVKIGRETLRSTWSDVYQHVREVYSKVILNQKRLELAEDNLNAMRQFFGRVQERYQSGLVLKNDFQRAKIEMLNAEHGFLSVQKELASNRARLNLGLGRPMDTPFEVAEQLKEERLLWSIDQLKSLALANRPDVRIAGLELDSKNKNVVKAQLNRLPSYSVGFRRIDEDDEDDYAIVVGISLPLWNLNQGEIKKAKAEKAAQTVMSDAVKEEAMFQVYESYLEAELAQKQFELSKKSLDEANELFRLANLRYSEGKIDFLNYLDQVRTAAAAKVKYFEGLFELSRSMSALEASIYVSLRQEDFFNE